MTQIYQEERKNASRGWPRQLVVVVPQAQEGACAVEDVARSLKDLLSLRDPDKLPGPPASLTLSERDPQIPQMTQIYYEKRKNASRMTLIV